MHRGAGMVDGTIQRLVDALEVEGIEYCHWKSNEAIAASASGENDLDLLVGRADAGRCRALLHQQGFVEGVQPPSRRLPGVLDYHGISPELGRPVHVHLHSRLVLGDDTTKNYRLPIEQEYLASATREGLFRLPAPEFELAVFVLRMVLKHSTWDAMLMTQGRLSASEQRELRDLQERAQPDAGRQLVDKLLPEVGGELFEECTRAITGRMGPVERAAVARRLEAALAPFGRRPAALDGPMRVVRRGYWLSRRYVRPRSRRKAVATGGLVVAIRGGDRAAPQRLVAQLDEWLSRDFAVLPLEPGAEARAVRRALRFAASGGIVLTAGHPDRADGLRPDLEVVLDDADLDGVTAPGVVRVGGATSAQEAFRAVQQRVWSQL